MWPYRIQPYKGEHDNDGEPFEDWFERVQEHIPNVPKQVAEQWIHRHWSLSPFDFLPLYQLRFQLETWPIERVRKIGARKKFGSLNRTNRLGHDASDGILLAEMMLRDRTWPVPIMVIDNTIGLQEPSGEKLTRWHLLEGHQRLLYLLCLDHQETAKAEHSVWVVTIDPSLQAPALRRHGIGPTVGLNYIFTKLATAVNSLAVGTGSIQARLSRAYRALHNLSTESFPPEQRERWDEIMSIRSVGAMNDLAASHFAREILFFYEWACIEETAIKQERRTVR